MWLWFLFLFLFSSTGVLSKECTLSKQMKIFSGHQPGDYGSYFDCNKLDGSQYCLVSAISSPNSTSKLKCGTGIHIPQCDVGMCAPRDCPPADVSQIVANITHRIDKSFEGTFVANCVRPVEWHWNNILCLVLLCVLVLLSLIGTVVDLYTTGKLRPFLPCWREHEPEDEEDPLLAEGDEAINVERTQDKKNLIKHEKREERHEGKFVQFLKAFSFTYNWSRLFAPIPGNFGFLNGVRVLSMFWIILGHSYDFLGETGTSNLGYVFQVLGRWTFQFIFNAPFAVDSFFFLSGFLLAYFMMKELYDKGRFSLVLYYFHRFWRLLPLYMFLLFLYTNLSPYIANGPTWFEFVNPIHANNEYCWTNVLFINNFYPGYKNMCMRWSWFLADDMQFYIISPIIIYSYYRFPIVGILLLKALFIMCWTTTALLLDKHFDMSKPYQSRQGLPSYFDIVYDKPYTRIAPYLIGIETAYFLWYLQRNTKTKKGTVRVHPLIVFVALLISGLCLAGIVFGTKNNSHWGKTANILFETFGRSVFTFGLAILVLLMSIGYGGIITSILSLSIWDPFAKLTYGAYLIHPVVIRAYYHSKVIPPSYSDINMIYWFLGSGAVAYTLGALSYVLVEKPFMNLEALFLPKRKH